MLHSAHADSIKSITYSINPNAINVVIFNVTFHGNGGCPSGVCTFTYTVNVFTPSNALLTSITQTTNAPAKQSPGAWSFTFNYTFANSGAYALKLVVTGVSPPTASFSITTNNIYVPLAVSLSPSSATIGNGQTAPAFTATPSGGTIPLYYSWTLGSGLSVVSGCATGNTATTCTVSGLNSGTSPIYPAVTVLVHDSNTIQNRAADSAVVTVNAGLGVSVSATRSTIDAGQSDTFSANALGGHSSVHLQMV